MDSNKLKRTEDGSHTIHCILFNETYHSTFGAIQESKHIFIQAGLNTYKNRIHPVHILEIGFGSGLNALLSLQWAQWNAIDVNYLGIEAYPISETMVKSLNYPEVISLDPEIFYQLHKKGKQQLSAYFSSEVLYEDFKEFVPKKTYYDIIYFDAFSPEIQPEMWLPEGFRKLFEGLKTGGILVTYSCKGKVKRALKEVGFKIEKLPGPPGKREFIRAVK